MKFEFKNNNTNPIDAGDIIMTTTQDVFMIIQDKYTDYTLLNLKTFSIYDEYTDYAYTDQLISDFQDKYDIVRVIKNNNLVLKEEKQDDWY